MADVIMPKMGDAMETGTLVAWLKQNGEEVKAGDPIAEIETDKSNVEIEAEETGVFQRLAAEGDAIPVGGIIARIGDADAQPAAQFSPPSNGAQPTVAAHREEPRPPVEAVRPPAPAYSGPTVSISYSKAVQMALREELERDPDVYMLGEEIGQYQGTFKITEGFLDQFGPERIVDTPISEAAMVGMAVGSAMMGLRPVLEFMTFNFALVAWDQIINHAAKILYMSGGQFNIPLVMRGPAGVGGQLSAQHSQDLLHWYANVPGLKVVAPSTPADAKGLLKSAIRDNNPVIFTEHARLYGMRAEVPEDPDFLIPIGVADIKRTGADVTIISYSRGVHLSLLAAETLAKDGIDVEVVDLRSLQPIDWDTVLASVRKTHRAVVVQEQWLDYGIGAEFAARIGEEAFDELDAPVTRVAGAFVPMPYAKVLENLAVPNEEHIVAAVRKTVERTA
ncbi:MAG: pyruvate dehydrogenase complex E1 component subunit beta [Capsulimonadaceae bacterium]|nr:pyruvate dehydrogenase complex E1 component subunit beta [Capsulimonadaceae bacterium]